MSTTSNSSHRDSSATVRQLLQPLSRFLSDTQVTEIIVNTPGLVVVYRGSERGSYPVPELSTKYLTALTNALATYNGSALAPVLSVILPDGERGQIVSPPALLTGHVAINIRRHTQHTFTLDDLLSAGTFAQWRDVSISTEALAANPLLNENDLALLALKASGDIPAFLHQAVLQRRNIVIAGATRSGKTTFARALIDLVPTHERLITMEDVHELKLPRHENKVHLIYGDGAGRVSATNCIRSCMRMSPDRIFLAEIRGNEAWDYLAALNTGHPGTVTTTHANSAREAFSRLALLIKQSDAGRQLDLPTINYFLYSTLDVVLFFHEYKLKELWFDPQYAKSLTL